MTCIRHEHTVVMSQAAYVRKKDRISGLVRRRLGQTWELVDVLESRDPRADARAALFVKHAREKVDSDEDDSHEDDSDEDDSHEDDSDEDDGEYDGEYDGAYYDEEESDEDGIGKKMEATIVALAFKGTSSLPSLLDAIDLRHHQEKMSKVHRGFVRQYEHLKPEIETRVIPFIEHLVSSHYRLGQSQSQGRGLDDERSLESLETLENIETLENLERADGSKVHLVTTGHSMGGAQALISCEHISQALKERSLRHRVHVRCHAYGVPVFADRTFVRNAEEELDEHEVVNLREDVVTMFPVHVEFVEFSNTRVLSSSSSSSPENDVPREERRERRTWIGVGGILLFRLVRCIVHKCSFGLLSGGGGGSNGGRKRDTRNPVTVLMGHECEQYVEACRDK